MTSVDPTRLDGVTVVRASADDVRPLRARVLRQGLPPETARFDGDTDPATRHYAVPGDEGLPVAVVSFMQPDGPDAPWQLRGMAVTPAARGRGVGGALLQACLREINGARHGQGVWCNARLTAEAFYARHGFVREGEVFDLPGIGTHVRMRRPPDSPPPL